MPLAAIYVSFKGKHLMYMKTSTPRDVIVVRNLTKRFGTVVALDKVTLAVASGSVHCLVGENGAGKSTFVKLVTGILVPDGGSVHVNGRPVVGRHHDIAYVPQELQIFPHLTLIENVLLPFGRQSGNRLLYRRKALRDRVQAALRRVGLKHDPYTIMSSLSAADQQLVQIARAIIQSMFSALILDEPTASLTEWEVIRLFSIINELKDEGIAIILITHKLDEVARIADTVTVLRDGRQIDTRDQASASRAWMIQSMTGHSIDETATFRPKMVNEDRLAMAVDMLSGAKFDSVSFSVIKGTIVGIAGLVGAGRTELLQTIAGLRRATAGHVLVEGEALGGSNAFSRYHRGIVYVSEERKTEGIFSGLSVRMNVSIGLCGQTAYWGIIRRDRETDIAQHVLHKYRVKAQSVDTVISNLSGGNQQKILIGRAIEARPRVLLLDEPTRGIDIGAKEDIYSLIQSQVETAGLTVVMVSSELDELLKCCNYIYPMHHGHLGRRLDCARLEKRTLLEEIVGSGTTVH